MPWGGEKIRGELASPPALIFLHRIHQEASTVAVRCDLCGRRRQTRLLTLAWQHANLWSRGTIRTCQECFEDTTRPTLARGLWVGAWEQLQLDAILAEPP